MRAISGGRAGCSGLGGRAHPTAKRPLPERSLARRIAASADARRAGGEDDEPSLTLPLATPDTDWRAFRAQLVAATAAADERDGAEGGATTGAPSPTASAPPRPTTADGEDSLWAHRIAAPERGCLLVAHPLMFTTAQTYFSQVRGGEREAGGGGRAERERERGWRGARAKTQTFPFHPSRVSLCSLSLIFLATHSI